MLFDDLATATLPDGVTVAEVTRADGAVAPAIWIESQGVIDVLPEALSFAFSQVDLERPYQRIKQQVTSIAHLLRYFVIKGQPSLDERGFRKFLVEYFNKRWKGDPDLCWAPLSRPAMEAELRNIAFFSDYCELAFGYLPLLGSRKLSLPARTNTQRSFWKLMALNESDFFSHLAIQRSEKPELIALPGRKVKGGGSSGFCGMNKDFVWELIKAEKNPTFRAIWLLGFFGGPRTSEMMNLWVCDVLPGTWREHMFQGDIFTDLPLVVIANPWASKWCGKIGDLTSNRKDYLMKHYGLNPRPVMAETEAGEYRGKAAGYKGTRPTNNEGAMRQIFWTDIDAALHFEQTIIEVMQIRSRMPKSKLHPFLFVNTDPRQPDIQGEMLSLSNVRKAFERAVRRVGGTPYRFKQNPHGMRHFYTDLARVLCGKDESAVQICLGHYARASQDDYGSFDMKAMQHALASAHDRRRIGQ